MVFFSQSLLFLLFVTGLAADAAGQSDLTNHETTVVNPSYNPVDNTSWSLISDENGIKTYRKEITGSDVFPLKGVTILNAPLSQVVAVMHDNEKAPEWIDLLAEIRLIKKYSNKRFVLLYRMNSPFPLLVKKRDFLLESNFSYNKENNMVTLDLHSIEDPEAPPQEGYIRGHIYKSEWIFKSTGEEGKTEVILEYHVDPRGMIPKWMVRIFQANWPVKTLKALNRHLHKEKILK